MIIHKKCSYGAILWQKELVSEMKIYITYLGFIEALIIETKKNIDWNKNFNNEDSCREYEKKYSYYLEQRKKLLTIINSQTKLAKDLSLGTVLNKVLDYMPISDGFNILYKDMKINHYSLNLQLEFINAYNTGMMQNGYISYDYVTEQFEKGHEAIDTHKNNNKKKIAQLKLKYQEQ